MSVSTLFSLALVAGMLAAFNPCGFALLPTYLTLFVTSHRTGEAGEVRLGGQLAR